LTTPSLHGEHSQQSCHQSQTDFPEYHNQQQKIAALNTLKILAKIMTAESIIYHETTYTRVSIAFSSTLPVIFRKTESFLTEIKCSKYMKSNQLLLTVYFFVLLPF